MVLRCFLLAPVVIIYMWIALLSSSSSEDTDDELTWEELNELQDKQRKETLRQTIEDLAAVLSNKEGFKRLRAISDEEWAAAVERDRGHDDSAARQALAESRKRGKPETCRAELVDMICPLCGHDKAKRYPYQRNGWQYVCQGCKRAFDPGE